MLWKHIKQFVWCIFLYVYSQSFILRKQIIASENVLFIATNLTDLSLWSNVVSKDATFWLWPLMHSKIIMQSILYCSNNIWKQQCNLCVKITSYRFTIHKLGGGLRYSMTGQVHMQFTLCCQRWNMMQCECPHCIIRTLIPKRILCYFYLKHC